MALLGLSPWAAFAAPNTDSVGHVHQTIAFFGPLAEAQCIAMRGGNAISLRQATGDDVPVIDADTTESQDDIVITCTRADRVQVSVTLHWGTYLTYSDHVHGAPAPCPRPYRLDEVWPTECWVNLQISYPRHVVLRFDGEPR